MRPALESTLLLSSVLESVASKAKGARIGLADGATKFHEAEIAARHGDTITVDVFTKRLKTGQHIQAHGLHEISINLGSDFSPESTYLVKVNGKATTFKMP